MSGISVQGEQSTSSEITALANLTALSTSSAGQFLRKTGLLTFENATPAEAGLGDALVANPLSQFAATTSLQLLGVISDETGSGSLVFATSPTLVTPALGTPSALVGTNITGTAASLTAGLATILATARTIGGVSFDGSANIVPQTIQSINEATDTTCFPLFISASGSQSLQP